MNENNEENSNSVNDNNNNDNKNEENVIQENIQKEEEEEKEEKEEKKEKEKEKENKVKKEQRFTSIIRIRPQVKHDEEELTTEDQLRPVISKINEKTLILHNEKTDSSYSMLFDRVFDERSTQPELFAAVGERAVADLVRGYNATVLAYGQTGSGKSYTVFGVSGMEDSEVDIDRVREGEGVVPRAVKQIFEFKNAAKGSRKISISVSFFQIYLNQITDLLEEEKDVVMIADKDKFRIGKNEGKNLAIENSLKITHNKDGKIILKDAKGNIHQSTEFDNEEDLLLAIEDGVSARITEETIMNKTSSRSHAILQITLRQKWIERVKNQQGEISDTLHNLKGTLTFVDLAGSESVSRTGSTGRNRDEAKEINKSINALGRVIDTLVRQSEEIERRKYNENKEDLTNLSKAYIGFRDNRLTELLSEALGGNSKTYIIACVSPFNANVEESLSTLLFASRAKAIRTSAKKNEKIAKINKDNKGSGSENNSRFYGEESGKGKESRFNKMKNYSKSIGNSKYSNKGLNLKDDILNKKLIFGFGLNKPNSYNKSSGNDEDEEKKENYKALTKKFYSVILHLQDELGKLIIQNYSLEQENNYLKEQLNNLS